MKVVYQTSLGVFTSLEVLRRSLALSHRDAEVRFILGGRGAGAFEVHNASGLLTRVEYQPVFLYEAVTHL